MACTSTCVGPVQHHAHARVLKHQSLFTRVRMRAPGEGAQRRASGVGKCIISAAPNTPYGPRTPKFTVSSRLTPLFSFNREKFSDGSCG
eukprot:1985306-Pleurochrysis_carterae.AAC.3